MPAVPPSVFSMEDANARFNNGFPALIGLHFLEWEEGRAVLGLQVRQEHLNLGNVIHGGVLATLMDVAGACAGTYCPYPERVRKAVTLSMTTTFTGQAGEGLIRAIASASSNWSAGTSIREGALQLWPVLFIIARTPWVTAFSRSQPGSKMLADLPPSSRDTRLMVAAASRLTDSPARVEPVRETTSIRGSLDSSGPTLAPSP